MIYLDHAATTPIHEEVLKRQLEIEQTIFGNPSSIHSFGRSAKAAVEQARGILAKSIGADDKEVIFTSGGTEANNLAILGVAFSNQHKGNHIITTTQEHQAVLKTMEYLQTKGFHVTYLPVDESGQIKVDDLVHALSANTILVSIMTVNNETGVIQPIEACAKVLKDHQTYFHTDAVQAYGMMEMDVGEIGIDLLTTSAHKINGPKGIGFLYVADDVLLEAIHYGGEQERKRRPGTENVAGIVGFAKACEIAYQHGGEHFAKYKYLFLGRLKELGVNYTINGDEHKTIAKIINLSFPGIKLDVLLTNLDLAGIAVSSGSACSAGTTQVSHVLEAMYKRNDQRTLTAVRFSFGTFNTEENIVVAADKIAEIINRITD